MTENSRLRRTYACTYTQTPITCTHTSNTFTYMHAHTYISVARTLSQLNACTHTYINHMLAQTHMHAHTNHMYTQITCTHNHMNTHKSHAHTSIKCTRTHIYIYIHHLHTHTHIFTCASRHKHETNYLELLGRCHPTLSPALTCHHWAGQQMLDS